MKKKFMPAFEPPRLVTGEDRWYILIYAPNEKGDKVRYRPTFNLNRIQDLRLRKARGKELVNKILWWLQNGQAVWLFDEALVGKSVQLEMKKNRLPETNIIDAFLVALKLKTDSDRKDTNRTYSSISDLFIAFLKKEKLDQLMIKEFSKRHAMAYMDHCVLDRKVGPHTYNNNIIALKALMYALIEREYYEEENPFSMIKMKAGQKKKRRNFSQEEAKVVIAHIHKHEPMLMIALLLEYCCFVRPTEIRYMKFGQVNLDTGMVFIPSTIGKTKEDRHLTIPNEFIKYFDTAFFKAYPSSYYIFGEGFLPHHCTVCGKNTMGNKHRLILKNLHKHGKLKDITGLQWYSWKDTGITDALEELPLLAVQDQAGHSTPEMTLKYRHKRLVNTQMKEGFKNKVM